VSTSSRETPRNPAAPPAQRARLSGSSRLRQSSALEVRSTSSRETVRNQTSPSPQRARLGASVDRSQVRIPRRTVHQITRSRAESDVAAIAMRLGSLVLKPTPGPESGAVSTSSRETPRNPTAPPAQRPPLSGSARLRQVQCPRGSVHQLTRNCAESNFAFTAAGSTRRVGRPEPGPNSSRHRPPAHPKPCGIKLRRGRLVRSVDRRQRSGCHIMAASPCGQTRGRASHAGPQPRPLDGLGERRYP